MKRFIIGTLMNLILLNLCSCSKPKDVAEAPTRISATDLYKAFQQDADSAKRRFEGKAVTVTGKISGLFTGGPPGSHPAITFMTDSGGSVSCQGDPLIHIFDKLQKGQEATVTCTSTKILYSPQPNNSVELDGCSPD
jgi:hypothetical protein